MSDTHSHDVSKQVKTYRIVGAVLMAGTVITVLASNVHLGIILGIIVAIIIAVVKGSLVAGYFMHLLAERKLIYGVLALTAVFVLSMIGLMLFSRGDQQGHNHGIFAVPAKHVAPHSAEARPE